MSTEEVKYWERGSDTDSLRELALDAADLLFCRTYWDIGDMICIDLIGYDEE
jgi:hypothetical protein